MLSAVLKSKTAIEVSIDIMQAFVQMRRFIADNALIFQRIDRLEKQQLITTTKVEQVFQAIEDKNIKPQTGIFFEGQVFDAYVFVSKLIKQAKKSIILDETEVYHIGASLKDLGKKWFAFSRLEKNSILEIFKRLK